MRTKIAAKALCVLLLICIMSQLAVFATVATTVTDEYDLADALMAGGNVTLSADVELFNETITVCEDTVLDLNGYTVFTESGFTDLLYLSEGVSLTIRDSSANQSGALDASGVTDSAVWISSKAELCIEGGSFIKGNSSYGIANEGGRITVSGGKVDKITVLSGSVSITGGVFAFDPAAWLESGYTAAKNGAVWTVQKTETIPDPEEDPIPAFDLQSAMDAGGTVVLDHNLTLTETVIVRNTVTLDLNGFTMDGGDGVDDLFRIDKADAELTLTDSAGDGMLDADSVSDSAIWMTAGNLVMLGGHIKAESDNYGLYLDSDASFTVHGGRLDTAELMGSVTLLSGAFGFNPSSYLARGYETVRENGLWTVRKIPSAITGAQLALGNDLTLKCFATVDIDLLSPDLSPAVLFTLNQKTETLVTEYTMAGDEYVFPYRSIAPQYMGSRIDMALVLLNSDGEILNTLAVKSDYSILKNCLSILKKDPNNKTLKTLVADLLSYGAAAQEYCDYQTDALVNEQIEGGSSWTPLTSTDLSCSERLSEELYFISAGVYFDCTNRLYFKFRTFNVEKTEVRIDGKTYTAQDFIRTSATGYMVYGEPIYATGFDDVYTVELIDTESGEVVQTLQYSMRSYVYAMQDDGDPLMRNLARALYLYGLSAKAYEG